VWLGETVFGELRHIGSGAAERYGPHMWIMAMVATGLLSMASAGWQWWQLQSLRGARRVAGVVQARQMLRAPVSRTRCVWFRLSLHRSAPGATASSVSFVAQQPFSLVVDGVVSEARLDERFVMFGAEPTWQPLPLLPAVVEGLLVAEFGRKGGLWAANHAVNAEEYLLADGAKVDALVRPDGHMLMLSLGSLDEPLHQAAVMIRRSLASGVGLLALAWWLSR
jgi:hypothetical protein